MNQRRRARVVLAVLVLASLVLVTADFRSDEGPLDGVRGLATRVLEPVQSAFGAVTRPVVDLVANTRELWSIRGDNEQLRAEVEALRARQQSADAIAAENDRLRALLELRDGNDWQTVTAETVAFTPSNFEWTITIDVGSDAGVEPGMPVVEGAGLVGKVIQVTPTSSRVLLAIDPNFSAATRTAVAGHVGVITGRGSALMRMQVDDARAEIAVGDEIVTNNYGFGVFPFGIPIGIVDSLVAGPSELSQSVLVRPFVDFDRLATVLVVLQYPTDAPPPVPDLPEQELDPPTLVPDEEPSQAPPVDPDAIRPEEDEESDEPTGTDA